MARSRRKCACYERMIELAEDGRFPKHRRSKTIMGRDQRVCSGSNRTPEAARASVASAPVQPAAAPEPECECEDEDGEEHETWCPLSRKYQPAEDT